MYACMYVFIYGFSNDTVSSWDYIGLYSFIYLFIHSFVHSCIYLFIYSFIYGLFNILSAPNTIIYLRAFKHILSIWESLCLFVAFLVSLSAAGTIYLWSL